METVAISVYELLQFIEDNSELIQIRIDIQYIH